MLIEETGIPMQIRYFRLSCAGLLLAILAQAARAQTGLPTTEVLMNALGTCAAGMNLRLSANMTGSVRSLFEGMRTEGTAVLENAPEFLKLFPDSEKMNAYRLYIDCVTKIIAVPRDRINAPRSESCVAIAVECDNDKSRRGPASIRSCQRYVDCDPENPWARSALADAFYSNEEIAAAEVQYQRIVSIAQGSNSPSALGVGYNGLAKVYAWRQDRQGYDEAERYAKMAIQANSRANFPRGLGDNYRMLGTVYMFQGDFANAKSAYDSALSYYGGSGWKYGIGTVEAYIGDLMIRQGDLQNGCAQLRRARVTLVEAGHVRAVETTDRMLTQRRC
jgi:tetratricopeptide (TPR) repeat protein